MPRFFQHVEPGELQGKVTRLKYIDDVSDDELILYYFEDGTKCNKDYIGSTNETEESIKKFVMVELSGPTYQWQFMKKEVHADTSKMMRDDATGQVYEGVGPDVKLGGGPGTQNRSIEKIAKDGIRIEITAPRKNERYVPEADDNYCLSIKPELEHDTQSSVGTVVNNTVQSNVKHTVVQEPVKTVIEVDESSAEKNVIKTPVQTQTLQVTPSVQQSSYIVRKNAVSDLTIDLDNIKNDESIGKICFVADRVEVSYSVNELICLLNSNILNKLDNGGPEMDTSKENVLITNMIDKSKKKNCIITMNLTLSLPPKEVYDTIKSVYEEGLADEFVKCVTVRIPHNDLIESLSNGLTAYYNGTLTKKTQASTKKEDA